jgi:hypothetical protein
LYLSDNFSTKLKTATLKRPQIKELLCSSGLRSEPRKFFFRAYFWPSVRPSVLWKLSIYEDYGWVFWSKAQELWDRAQIRELIRFFFPNPRKTSIQQHKKYAQTTPLDDGVSSSLSLLIIITIPQLCCLRIISHLLKNAMTAADFFVILIWTRLSSNYKYELFTTIWQMFIKNVCSSKMI